MRCTAWLGLVLLAALAAGCGGQGVRLDAAQVSRVVLSGPDGTYATTNRADVARLAAALRRGVPDDTLYDTAKTTRIEVYAGTERILLVAAGGPLFDAGGRQYYDRSGAFREVVDGWLGGRPVNGAPPVGDGVDP